MISARLNEAACELQREKPEGYKWLDRAIEESVMTKRAISGDTRTASHCINHIKLDAISPLKWEMFCDDYPEAAETLVWLSNNSR